MQIRERHIAWFANLIFGYECMYTFTLNHTMT